jgi:hypothetical protein
MDRYDPDDAPIPAEWLSLDEGEQLFLIERYHRAARVRLPNPRLHATIHSIVENQLALDDQVVVRDTLQRLMAEGLSRHDAVHAIGSVLAAQIYDLLKSEPPPDPQHAAYYAALRRLTAQKWRES